MLDLFDAYIFLQNMLKTHFCFASAAVKCNFSATVNNRTFVGLIHTKLKLTIDQNVIKSLM